MVVIKQQIQSCWPIIDGYVLVCQKVYYYR